MTMTDFGGVGHLQLLKTGLRAVGITALLVTAYYILPIAHRHHESVALRLGVAFAIFAAALIYEVQAIVRSEHPMLRATVAMATIIPLFLIMFAWIYLTMSLSNPGTFGHSLSRTSSLYFTVTVFSTVGFGDITPKTDVARLVAIVQMMADLIVVGVVIRLILGAASRGSAERSTGGE